MSARRLFRRTGDAPSAGVGLPAAGAGARRQRGAGAGESGMTMLLY